MSNCPKCGKEMHTCINVTLIFKVCPSCQIFEDMDGKTITRDYVNSFGGN